MTRQRSEETSGGGLRKPELTSATKGESKSEDTTQNHFGVLAGRRSIAGGRRLTAKVESQEGRNRLKSRRSTAKVEGRQQRSKVKKKGIDSQGRRLNKS